MHETLHDGCVHAMRVRYERLYDLDPVTWEWTPTRTLPAFVAVGSCIACGAAMCTAAHPDSARVCFLAAGHEGAHRAGGDGGAWIEPLVPDPTA